MTQVRPVLDVPFFHKTYELYKLLHSYHNQIPKMERYTLWQKIENTTLSLLEALIETTYRKGEERLQSLYILSNKLDLLKVLVRLARETKTIDNKKYIRIQEIVQEMGKMIGGWIKYVPH